MSAGLTAADYEEALVDQRRLVRELDVLINGEAGAAQQASLGDIICQIQHSRRRFGVTEMDIAVLRAAFITAESQPDGYYIRVRLPGPETLSRAHHALLSLISLGSPPVNTPTS